MNRTNVAIHDIAGALCRLKNVSEAQRVAIYIKSLESLVRFAISEHECAQINGIRDDLERVTEIQERSRKV